MANTIEHNETFYVENPDDDFFVIPDNYTFIKNLDITYTNNVHIPCLSNLKIIRTYDSHVRIPDKLPNLHIVICQMIEDIKINLENYYNLIILKDIDTQILSLDNHHYSHQEIAQILRNNNIRIIPIHRDIDFDTIEEFIEYCNDNNF